MRRAIHATADFELRDRFVFSPTAVEAGLAALRQRRPLVVDVRMVAAGIQAGLAAQGIPLHCALDWAEEPLEAGQTRTAQGMVKVARRYPEAIFVVGNAPTALLALVEEMRAQRIRPSLVIGVPVGFVAVEEAKRALAQTDVPPDSGGGPQRRIPGGRCHRQCPTAGRPPGSHPQLTRIGTTSSDLSHDPPNKRSG